MSGIFEDDLVALVVTKETRSRNNEHVLINYLLIFVFCL